MRSAVSPAQRQQRFQDLSADQQILQRMVNNISNTGGTAHSISQAVSAATHGMVTDKGKDTAQKFGENLKKSNYDLSGGIEKYTDPIKEFNKAVEQSGSVAKSAAGGITSAFNAIKTSGLAAKAGALATNVAMGALASVLTTVLVSAISSAIDWIKTASTYDQEKIDKADKTRSNYSEKIQEKNTNLTTLKSNKDEFLSLSKGVDEYGKNISLDTSSYERFLDIRQQIIDSTPSVIEGYDAEGNAIVKTADLMDRAIESQQKSLEKTRASYGSEKSWNKIVKGNIESLKKKKVGSMSEKEKQIQRQLGIGNNDSTLKQRGEAVQKAYKQITEEDLDLTTSDGISNLYDNFDQIIEQIEKDGTVSQNGLTSLSHLTKNTLKEWKAYDNAYQKVQKQINEDFSKVASSANGYGDLSTEQQSFVNALGKNWIDYSSVSVKDVMNEDWQTSQKDNLISSIEKITGDKNSLKYLDQLVELKDPKSGEKAKDWSEDIKKAYTNLKDASGLDAKKLKKALTDGFDIKIDKEGNILNGEKNVQQMLDKLKETFSGKEGATFADNLNFSELSQAFDIVNSKTQTWTGSLDQLKSRLKLINKTNTASTWSDYLTAAETANDGATYLSMREAFNNQKKERDKGLIGTDDFKTMTSLMSGTKKSDAETFDKTWDRITYYFTEDDSGLIKFLDDIQEKSQASEEEFGKFTKTVKNGQDTWNVKDLNVEAAAKAMGMGVEPFEAILNRLKDYDFEVDFDSVAKNYKEMETVLDNAASSWQNMESGAGKTAWGEEIENYRQQLIKAQQEGSKIPDETIKKLKFEVSVADAEADYETALSNFEQSQDTGTKKEQKESAKELIKTADKKVAALRSSALSGDKELNSEGKAEKEEYDSKYKTAKANLRKNPSEETKKEFEAIVAEYDEFYQKVNNNPAKFTVEGIDSLKKDLKEINSELEVNGSQSEGYSIKLTADDTEALQKVQAWNKEHPETQIKITADETEAEKIIEKLQDQNEGENIVMEVDADSAHALSQIEGVQAIQIGDKWVVIAGNNLDAKEKIEDTNGMPVKNKGLVITGDNSSAISAIREANSELGRLSSNKEINIAANVTTNMPAYMQALFLNQGTAHANGTIKQSALDKAASKINASRNKSSNKSSNKNKKTKKQQAIDSITNQKLFGIRNQGSAHVHGTIGNLNPTDWDEDEFDEITGAYAHGTIPKLHARALATGTVKINNLSEIDPIINTERDNYVQEKKDRLKSSIGQAHAGGDWGLKQNEHALTGELGPEIVV